MIAPHLPPDRLDVQLLPGGDGESRVIEIAPQGARWDARVCDIDDALASAGTA